MDKSIYIIIPTNAGIWNVFITCYVCMYVCRFRNVVLRCPTPRLHCFLFSHWPSFRFLSFMAFLTPFIQFFFGLPRALFCFGIHFNVILGNLPSATLWIWPYHVSWFRSIYFTIVITCYVITHIVASYSLPKCFDRRHGHHQANLQHYNKSQAYSHCA